MPNSSALNFDCLVRRYRYRTVAVRDGRVERPHRGIIALPGADSAYAEAYRFNGRLTCASAAGYYGLWPLRRPDRLHLGCRHARLPDSVVSHRRYTDLRRSHVPVDPLIEVLYQAIRCLPAMEALVMTESAVAMAWMHPETLRDKLSGNRNGKAARILDLVEGSESPLGPLARVVFRQAGIYTGTHVDIPGVLRYLYDDVVHTPDEMLNTAIRRRG